MKRWNAAKAKRQLDALWSQIIHKRDNHCRFCGRTTGLANAHHIHSRRHLATRWDIRNGVRVCFSCHNTAHNDIPWGHNKAIEAIGEQTFDLLNISAHCAVHKFDRAYYAAKLIELQKLNEQITHGPKNQKL